MSARQKPRKSPAAVSMPSTAAEVKSTPTQKQTEKTLEPKMPPPRFIRTRQSNANAHPGIVDLDPEQPLPKTAEEKRATKAAKKAADDKAAELRKAKVAHAAQIQVQLSAERAAEDAQARIRLPTGLSSRPQPTAVNKKKAAPKEKSPSPTLDLLASDGEEGGGLIPEHTSEAWLSEPPMTSSEGDQEFSEDSDEDKDDVGVTSEKRRSQRAAPKYHYHGLAPSDSADSSDEFEPDPDATAVEDVEMEDATFEGAIEEPEEEDIVVVVKEKKKKKKNDAKVNVKRPNNKKARAVFLREDVEAAAASLTATEPPPKPAQVSDKSLKRKETPADEELPTQSKKVNTGSSSAPKIQGQTLREDWKTRSSKSSATTPSETSALSKGPPLYIKKTLTSAPGVDANPNQDEADSQDQPGGLIEDNMNERFEGPGKTPKMTVKIEVDAPAQKLAAPKRRARGTAAVQKKNPTNADLPFNDAGSLKKWRTTFLNTIFSRLGTEENPWEVSGEDDFLLELLELFNDIFPQHKLATLSSKDPVYRLMSQRAYEWRSDIGSQALKAVEEFWTLNPENTELYATKEAKSAYIARALTPLGPKKGLRFLYENLETGGGILCSQIIVYTYAYHLQLEYNATYSFGHANGALSLSVAAVERSLRLWSDGEKPTPTRDDSFSSANWGQQTGQYATTVATHMNDKRWDKIKTDAWKVVQELRQSGTMTDPISGGESEEGSGRDDIEAYDSD